MKLSEIFTQNGYTVKATLSLTDKEKKILAIGTNEALWIGGIGLPTDQVRNAINTLNQEILDTLDGVHINIQGFSIHAPDAHISRGNDILLFNTLDDLAIYLAAHKNPAPTGQEKEDFKAYSTYIDTLLEYIETRQCI